jgi:hypothetical protein
MDGTVCANCERQFNTLRLARLDTIGFDEMVAHPSAENMQRQVNSLLSFSS